MEEEECIRILQFKLRRSPSSCCSIYKGITCICSLFLRGCAVIQVFLLALDFADCLASLTEPFPSTEKICLFIYQCSKGRSPVFHHAECLEMQSI